jgi:hypothetical protein
MSAHFKSFLKGLLEKNKDKRRAPSARIPAEFLFYNQTSRLDWPALADHPFIADCDVLAPVVYLPGAVEYSQLPRRTMTPVPAAAPAAAASAVAEADAACKPSSAGSSSSRSSRVQPTVHTQQQQQQQQQQLYLRAGSPAGGRSDTIVDVLQFRGEGKGDVSLPLSDVVGYDDDDGDGDGDDDAADDADDDDDLKSLIRCRVSRSTIHRAEARQIQA